MTTSIIASDASRFEGRQFIGSVRIRTPDSNPPYLLLREQEVFEWSRAESASTTQREQDDSTQRWALGVYPCDAGCHRIANHESRR